MMDMGNRHSATNVDEIDLRHILRFLWVSRWPIVLPALICLLSVMLFQGLQVFTLGGPVTHSVVVRFTFPGADGGQYPNGQPFALSDVISGMVLQEVSTRLSGQGIDVDPGLLAERVSIQPYAPTEPFIVRRFKDRLENKDLTGTEIQALEAEFQSELRRATHQSARISIAFERGSTWSPEIAEKILHEIPRAWSEVAVERLGMLDIPVPGGGEMLLDASGQAEFLVLLAQVRSFTRRIIAGLGVLDADERARLAIDPVTGFRARDFIASGEDLLRFELLPLEQAVIQQGVFRDVSETVAYFEAKLHEEMEARAELLRKGEMISAVLQQYETGGAKMTQAMAGAGGKVAESVTVEYMDKMLAIGSALAESEFRQKLAAQHLQLMVDAEESTTRIRHLTRVLESARQHLEGPPPDAPAVEARMQELVVAFTTLRDGYDRLRNTVRAVILGSTGRLYRMQSGAPAVFDPSMASARHMFLWALLALMLGGMAGIVIQLVRLALLMPVVPQSSDQSGTPAAIRHVG